MAKELEANAFATIEMQANRQKQKQLMSTIVNRMAGNATLLRREVLQNILGETRDLNFECHYPDVLGISHYKAMWDREGLGTRVVSAYPEESWAMPPEIFEQEKADDTEFEKALKVLINGRNLFSFMERADTLSGIGQYGILLIGINDGLSLDKPVEGIDENTGEVTGGQKRELLYLRPFDEGFLKIDLLEKDVTSPRFGFPKLYDVNFVEGSTTTSQSRKVHWSRVVHIADNRTNSEVFGIPRMRPVFNRLLDLRKLLAGSAEMFWKGAFPGYAFEINPDMADVEMDVDSIKKEFRDYSDGLQRYLAIEGVSVKSLEPQVADPSNQFMTQIKAIALSLGIPYRVLLGTEEAKLAGAQDTTRWNGRLAHRQNYYLTPLVIRPVIDRFIAFGILPEPKEYKVVWPDLNSPSDEDVAKVAKDTTDAFAKYVGGGVDQLIPPIEYLMTVFGMSQEEADAIVSAAEKRNADVDVEREADLERREEEVARREAAQPVEE